MINMDMVGRLRDNKLAILGGGSAEEWPALAEPLCAARKVLCTTSGDGYGPSDQTPFYAAGIPILHLFTGTHDDYHRPSDDSGRINATGGATVAALAADLAAAAAAAGKLTLRAVPEPAPRGDVRSFGASLGTIPDYTGPGEGKSGVLLSGVRPGSAAEKAGMQRGDILIGLLGRDIGESPARSPDSSRSERAGSTRSSGRWRRSDSSSPTRRTTSSTTSPTTSAASTTGTTSERSTARTR